MLIKKNFKCQNSKNNAIIVIHSYFDVYLLLIKFLDFSIKFIEQKSSTLSQTPHGPFLSFKNNAYVYKKKKRFINIFCAFI